MEKIEQIIGLKEKHITSHHSHCKKCGKTIHGQSDEEGRCDSCSAEYWCGGMPR